MTTSRRHFLRSLFAASATVPAFRNDTLDRVAGIVARARHSSPGDGAHELLEIERVASALEIQLLARCRVDARIEQGKRLLPTQRSERQADSESRMSHGRTPYE